jgi:hypothetical protein
VNRAPAATKINADIGNGAAPRPALAAFVVRKPSSPLLAPSVATDAQDSTDALDGFFAELGSTLLDGGGLGS